MESHRLHLLTLLEPPIGVAGVGLFNLGHKTPLLRAALEETYSAVEAGELRAVVDRVFALDRGGAIEAHSYLHERRNLGKVVLAVAEATESFAETNESLARRVDQRAH
jgi:NADPH:quinone reductase-like Zn-dependent oxidoreductase